jgi:hypothetical protein
MRTNRGIRHINATKKFSNSIKLLTAEMLRVRGTHF